MHAGRKRKEGSCFHSDTESHTRTHTQNRFLWEGGWTAGGWVAPRSAKTSGRRAGQGTLTPMGPPNTPWGPDLN